MMTVIQWGDFGSSLESSTFKLLADKHWSYKSNIAKAYSMKFFFSFFFFQIGETMLTNVVSLITINIFLY